MFVRIGLVIVAVVLTALLFLGVGAGLGYVRIGSDGIAFGKDNDSADAASDSKTVSADELLRRKGISVNEPAAQPVVQIPKPAPAPAIVTTPTIVPAAIKPAVAEKSVAPAVADKPIARAEVRDRSEGPDPRDDNGRGAKKSRQVAERDAENRDGVKRKKHTPDAEAARENTKPPGPSWVIRVAAGYDKPITDPAGNVWEAASGFEGGEIVSRGEINIENSKFPLLYRQERRKMVSWKRQLPTGRYVVLLHFAESYEGTGRPEQRVFGIELPGQSPMKIDVAKEAGGLRRELIKALPVSIPDNNLKLVIRFITTDKYVPMINGIEVIPIEGKAHGLSKDEMRLRAYDVRIAAGSAVPICEPTGTVWLPDLGFEGGQTVDRGAINVENTQFPDLFRFEHFGMSAWHIDVPNGDYTVNLHFAETWEGITAPGQRVFHVTVQDADLHNLDIFKESGGLRHALVKTFHVTVTNGKLTIQFQNTDKNVAEINGIEVIREK